jgi:hypothetical protein
MLFRETVTVYCETMRNAQIFSVGIMQSFILSKQVDFKMLINILDVTVKPGEVTLNCAGYGMDNRLNVPIALSLAISLLNTS